MEELKWSVKKYTKKLGPEEARARARERERERESESDRSGRSNRWIVCPFNLRLHRADLFRALRAASFTFARSSTLPQAEQRFSVLNEFDVDSRKSGSLLMQRSFFFFFYTCIYFAVCELICTLADYRYYFASSFPPV